MSALYDRIGGTYRGTRREDARIAAAITAALGEARSVVNVGAGIGAYEPKDREVLAIEPSATMIAQRPRGSAPAIQASAETLPIADASFDAALAVNTLQHWTDLRAGLRELRRVARQRIVIFMRHAGAGDSFWLTADYFPSLDNAAKTSRILAIIEAELPTAKASPFLLPHDCMDGLFTAHWRRPEMYLDIEVRRNISNFALSSPDALSEGLSRLRVDLESGAWDRKYGHLRSLTELDLGHRLIVAELKSP